ENRVTTNPQMNNFKWIIFPLSNMCASLEVLTLKERILTSVKLSESHFREFKSAIEGEPGKKLPRSIKDISKDIGETLVAFSNADGGEILIGIEDDGEITGIPHNEKEILTMKEAYKTNVHKDTPISNPIIHETEINGKKILYIFVDKGDKYCYLTSNGRCLQRLDKQNIPRPPEQILSDRRESISREYDRKYVDGCTTQNLDLKIINELVKMISPGSSAERCLQFLRLADYFQGSTRPTKAAVLLLAEDILRWYPRCEVRIIKVKGSELKTGG
ncbi:MAG: putative DNA binding domain-containing protein, partial [candidate division Zixibacteria bacterium]|nr:putative DNA binding domain-containing protein [candidate division Zixibacteria bacterium]